MFIGNLDPEVDEKLLYDTFSAFGVILQVPKIMKDADTNSSKGFAFINFASFEASDAALEAMNGQYLCNRPITISYAFKKEAKGERHGSEAERFLAAQNPLPQADRPHQLFADAPPTPGMSSMVPPAQVAMQANPMMGMMAGTAPPGMMSMYPGSLPPMPNIFAPQMQMPYGQMLPPPPGMAQFQAMGFPPMGLPPMPFAMTGLNPAMMRPQPPPPPPPTGMPQGVAPPPPPPPPPQPSYN